MNEELTIYLNNDTNDIFLPHKLVAHVGKFPEFVKVRHEGKTIDVPGYEKLKTFMPLELEFLFAMLGYDKAAMDNIGIPYELLPVIYAFFRCDDAFREILFSHNGCIYCWVVENFGNLPFDDNQLADLYEKEQFIMSTYNNRLMEITKHPNYIGRKNG